jgi:quercetin dioxygenase-like cupin family protein
MRIAHEDLGSETGRHMMSADRKRGQNKQPLATDETEPVVFQPAWVSRDKLPSFSPLEGFTMQSVSGGKLMANWVTIEPNREMPRHHHPHEQLGIMLEGVMELTLADETRLIRAGDAYTIPSNLPHNARTLDEGCVVLDIFTPPREDYGGEQGGPSTS